MSELNPIVLGVILLFLGAGFFFLTWLLVRAAPKLQPLTQGLPIPSNPYQTSSHQDAVLLIQGGGRVAYLNQQAREWFNLREEEPDLERLARRTRPSETFLNLCAGESQARLSLDGRFVDGISYFVPYGKDPAVLVSLQRPQWSAGRDGDPGSSVAVSNQMFSILTELNQAITTHLDLEATLQAILEGVERLIPSDFSEITIWDGENSRLIPYHFTGTAEVHRRLEKSSITYSPEQGYSGYLATHRTSLMVNDVEKNLKVRPGPEKQTYPFHSYLGVPLMIAGELIGTLELACLAVGNFAENDLEMLQAISGQAAVAVHNALLYEAEQRRAVELAGLANLAQAVSAIRDSQDLFTRLTESLAPILDTEIAGFLVYDEDRRTLEGKIPFIGIPEDLVAWYRVPIQPGMAGESIFQSMEMILATDGPRNAQLEALGLHDMAQVASIRQTVLAPLTSGGRMLGYFQVANKRDGSPFGPDDLRLLSIVAGQAAVIIDNATLVQQSRDRAQRAETLRRIASLTGSSATLEEVLKYSLLDLARLLQADVAAILLLDENRGGLRPHKPSLFGVPPEIATRLGRIPVEDPLFLQTVTGSQQQFLSGNLSEAPDLSLYHSLAESLKVQSVIDVPLIARERSLGEVILGSLKADFFNQGDVTSVETAAGQFAAAIEQSSLYSQTDQSLRQRVEQMTALAHISRELNSTLDLEHLLSRVFDEAVRTTGADCGKILLFNVGEEQPDLRGVMLSVGEEPTPDLHPLEQVVLKENESLIVNDFANLEEEPPSEWYESLSVEARASLSPLHAEVRSALIVPITYQGQVAGLIHLHARSPHHFDSALREISETLAVQAAIALGNAQRYQEQVQRSELLNRRVETLSRLFEVSQSLQSEQSLEETLETIAYAIQSATPFDLVLISVYEPQNNHLRPLANAGLPLSGMEALVANPQNWDSLKPLLCPEFRVSRSYFIPHEKMPVIPADVHALTLLPPNGTGAASDEWHPDDMLLLPLTDGSERALGLISVDGPRDHLRPDRPAVETLEIFGSQAAIAIENRQKLDALKTQVEEIRQDLASAQETATAAQQQLPVLLHKDLEQTLAIQHLSERARRISAGLGIAGLVNRQISRRNVLLILGQEILARMELETALIAEPGPEAADRAGSVRLFQTLGNLPEGANPEALLGQRNPLRQCLISGQIILVANLEEDSDWQSSPLLHALAAKSFICLPIFTEQGPDSAVLAISRSTAAPFTVEDVQLFALLTRQVAVALQNLTLIDETKRRLHEVNLLLDFSRQLGNLDTDSILHALVESAMHVAPNAQAAFVAIWDPLQELLSPKAATGYTNLTRLLEIRLRPGEALPGKVFEQRQATCLDDVDFARHYNFLPDNLLCYRDATEGHPPVSSMVVPIVGTTQITSLGVLVMDSFQTPAAFGQDEQALITSLAQQTALALENAGLYQASTQRAHQLEALTDVATTITSSLETDELVATLLDQLQSILPYETGTLWLRQEKEGGARQSMVVRAAGGFADSEQRVGLTVALEDSVLLSEMIHTGRPISVPDVRKDPRFPSLLEYEYQSWLGLPLVASGEVIGVIALEKAEANFYTPEYVQIATTFAGQAAVGLENANLYQESLHRAQELDQRSQFLAMLNRLSSELSGSLDAAHILNFTVQELFNVIRCSSTSAITFDAQRRAALVAEYPNTDDALPIRLPNAPIFDRLRQTQGIFQSEDATQEKELSLLSSFLIRYQTRSLLILPLAIGNELHGLLLAHTDQPYYFEPEEVEVGLTIGNQVAIAVQNARLFAETRSLTEDLEQRVQARTTELAREHHRTETLLRIITELSASLDLDQVLNRTLHVLNEMIDARQVTLLIARPGEKKLHRLASIGATPVTIEDESQSAITPDRGLAGWVISQRQGVLIDDVQQDPRWVQIPPQPTAYHRSALAVPLMIGAEALGCMLLFHDDPGHFSQDQLEMVQAAANQVAVAVNNAELYRLIRDQAEDLGSMLRNQQIETSRSKAILEAVADGVLVTDARRKITLFNASAEKILGLERNQVIGKSLEYFTGLFGKAAQSWRETINTWSLDPSTYQPGDTFAEQILLENGRVVAVRLAPVSLRNDFLGTVSIFQDITHQVEVDRLKSEFVATVSHELRTPMTSIKGYVDVLLMGAGGKISDQQKRFLGIVKTNTDRLAVLVNDLLDISRIESGRVTLSIQPLNMEEVLEESIADVLRRSQEENKPVKIQKEISGELRRVMGDFDRVRQILDNLLDNAYHYSPPEGRITVRMQPAGEALQVDVIDTGMGIPVEEQHRIFERFFRGEGPLLMGVSGTGLGLSIVQNLVQMHHGRIWFESAGVPGLGSTFSFTLPVYEAQPEGDESRIILESGGADASASE